MATNKEAVEVQKVESGEAKEQGDPLQVKILQASGKYSFISAPGVSKSEIIAAPVKQPSPGPAHQAATAAFQVSVPKTTMVAKVSPQVAKPVLDQVASTTSTQARTVVITVPRSVAPQQVAVAPCLPQISTQLPANLQIPPGMMLIRSDSGQLMLVSQQALAQAQQAPRPGPGPRCQPPQVLAVAGNKGKEKVTVIRMTTPPSLHTASVQKNTVVKVIGVAPKPAVVQTLNTVPNQGNQPQPAATETKKEQSTTFSQETLESVKKCKNFLVTLMKLASSDSKSTNLANNMRGLVRSLLEGKLEAEEFTEALYRELNSTPQPCLVPFLKKSLPAVRRLTTDPQLFIQQAPVSGSTVRQISAETGQSVSTSQQVIQQQMGVRPELSASQPQTLLNKSSRTISTAKSTTVQSTKNLTGCVFTQQPPASASSTKFAFNDLPGSYKEDDDINDVASMAGVNLKEENAQILTTTVGTVVQSCRDQPFLSPNPLHSRILRTGQALGVTDVSPEVVAVVSHATQERLRGLLEKLTVIAEHRNTTVKEDDWHIKVKDVRSQLRFLEEVESLKRKRREDEERERLLRLARCRSHTEDPEYQQLRQRAKELQQIEEAQLQQREANLAALAAIGPRKRRPLTQTDGQVSLVPRRGVPRVTRVMMKDLLMCLEQDSLLQYSLFLYKAML